MIVLFIGKQGSGKGTYGKVVADKTGLKHISTGDLLRQTEGELRKEVDSYILHGAFVPDELILKILKARIQEKDCEKGIILDGYPRNLKQAEELDKILKVDRVIEIYISDELAVGRLLGRVNCEKCGTGFNENTELKPREKGKCDKCGGKLVRRQDDNEELIKKRLEIYYKETAPLLEHYKNIVVRINGEGDINEVSDKIIKNF